MKGFATAALREIWPFRRPFAPIGARGGKTRKRVRRGTVGVTLRVFM